MTWAAETNGVGYLSNVHIILFQEKPALFQSLPSQIIENRGPVQLVKPTAEPCVCEPHGLCQF